VDTLKTAWLSPSNIALIKYWGKLPVQIPANPSISFTLNQSKTVMLVEAHPHNKKEISLDFYFEGEINEKFKNKIVKFLDTQTTRFPWLLTHHLTIRSENTFPHSSGIASSASSMSALNLCLLSLDEQVKGQKTHLDNFYREASELSRLASGSAGRSVYPFLVSWGKIGELVETSDLYATPLEKKDIHTIFHDYCDSIIIVDGGEKSVSSRAGHALMDTHPFKAERFKRARTNMTKLLQAMKVGDLETFIEVVEEEALMLHALMMTSQPSYILLKPESLLLIEKIREFRNVQKIPVCFTIDAGPNIHLLFPVKHKLAVRAWLTTEFSQFKIIHDEVGMGPVGIQS
jgi:diphosphomevalonate decarboxylase